MIPEEYKKRSFMKFNVPIDLEGVRREFNSIPDDAWGSSYWGQIHCSVGTLLLRGGETGTEDDFCCDEVRDQPLLASLPTISALLAEDGPFGGAIYAFIFRTEPNGVTMLHRDNNPVWEHMYRVHVPIKTNPGALLISDGRAIHFEQGHAWSFDNQSIHGVVNGPVERIHLIFDVPFNDVMAQVVAGAEFLPGEECPKLVEKLTASNKAKTSYPGDRAISRVVGDLRRRGMDDRAIAAEMNSKGIPTKKYGLKGSRHVPKKWNFKMVADY